MAHLEALEDKADPLWSELLAAFNKALADAADNSAENSAVKDIRQMLDRHGYHKLYVSLRSHVRGSLVDFLYWFARAGAVETIGHLAEYLDSQDEDDLVMVSLSLAQLGDERGFETIEKLLQGTHAVKLSMPPAWYLDGYIQHIPRPRGQALVKKYQPNRSATIAALSGKR